MNRLRRWLRSAWKSGTVWDLFALAGLSIFTAGCGWIYAPLAPIVLGLALVALGLWGAQAWSRAARKRALRRRPEEN
jgi:hypothetical protein